MKPPFKQRHPLLRPLVMMTISILILFLLSFFFIVTSSSQLKLNASVMKITASQKSLSQQIVNSIAADNIAGQTLGPSLASLMDSFTELQHVLLYGDKAIDVKPLKEQLIAEYHKLDIDYTLFFKQLNLNISNDTPANFIGLLNAENAYLQQLDNFSSKLTGYSNKEVRSFRVREICILCISIILIFIELRFIFLPAIKKMERQSTVLREISFTQSHIIRRPLTNIQSLLNLVLERKTEDPFNAQLLNLLKKEADELDAIIKKNVKKSDNTHHMDQGMPGLFKN